MDRGTETVPFRGTGETMRSRRARPPAPPRTRGLHVLARVIAAATATTTLLVGSPLPASARTVLTAPYARSATAQWCDPGAVCLTTTGADAATGKLLVDLSIYGTKTPQRYYCFSSWPPDPTCMIGGVRPAGGSGGASVVGTQKLSEPVTSVNFTVTMRIDEARAQSETGRAVGYVWASAAPADPSCGCGYGATSAVVVDSETQPTAGPTTRTLKFTYSNGPANSGGKLPAGAVEIAAGITVWVEGEGWSSARLPATVVSIASSA